MELRETPTNANPLPEAAAHGHNGSVTIVAPKAAAAAQAQPAMPKFVGAIVRDRSIPLHWLKQDVDMMDNEPDLDTAHYEFQDDLVSVDLEAGTGVLDLGNRGMLTFHASQEQLAAMVVGEQYVLKGEGIRDWANGRRLVSFTVYEKPSGVSQKRKGTEKEFIEGMTLMMEALKTAHEDWQNFLSTEPAAGK